MRICTAVIITSLLLPLNAFAQTEMVAPPSAPGLTRPVSPLLITAGIIGAAVVADIVTRGALSGPVLRRLGLRAVPAAAGAATRTVIRP